MTKISDQIKAMQQAVTPAGERESRTAELQRLHRQRKEIDERISAIKGEILAENPEEGTVENGPDGKPAYVVRRNGARFDAVQAAQVLPQPLLDLITVPAADGKIAKAKLPPDMYRSCLKEGKITIVLK